MADDPKQSAPGLAGNAFIWLLALISGTVLITRQAPYQDARPPLDRGAEHRQVHEPQDIDARLWQDPFAAVAKGKQEQKETVISLDAQGLVLRERSHDMLCGEAQATHCSPTPPPAPPVQILGIMVSGAPYSQDAEFRLRTRYAVLAGLAAEGYDPADSQHVGALSFTTDRQAPLIVPFEWFTPPSRGEAPTAAKGSVLALWLDEDALQAKPLGQLAEVTKRARKSLLKDSQASVKIIGPEYSATLGVMFGEAKPRGPLDKPCASEVNLDFYLYSATIPVEKDYDDVCLRFHRMIASDDVLASRIGVELSRRHISPTKAVPGSPAAKHHIALVGEWDSGYARRQPHLLASALTSAPQVETWLHSFSYLRGLDGERPSAQRDKTAPATPGDNTKTTAPPGPSHLEGAEGDGQFDYLRRLADRIRRTDQELRRTDNGQIDAIGIVGTDVYDKLLVLQALRPYFPDALFFTNDFDAVLLDPAQANWTRGLLIASSFGPQLGDAIQQNIPPFRSSYQTAAFLATRYAVHQGEKGGDTPFETALKHDLSEARLGEIERSGVLWLPSKSDTKEPADLAQRERERAGCRSDLLQCRQVNPPSDRLYPEFANTGAALAAFLGITALLLAAPFLSEGVRRRARWRIFRIKTRPKQRWSLLKPLIRGIAIAVLVAAALCGSWGWLGPWLTLEGKGEPMTLAQGISLWPTVLIRLFNIFLCVWFICDANRRLRHNLGAITRDFALPETPSLLHRAWDKGTPRGWARLLGMFAQNFARGSAPRSIPIEMRFWGSYVWQGRLAARVTRATVAVVAMSAFSEILVGFFGQPVVPSHRGAIGTVYFWVTSFSGIATLYLLFLIADAALYAIWFLRELRKPASRWPTKTTLEFQKRFGFTSSFPDDWIDLQFIAQRTKATSVVIYYPFIAIALMICSRSKIFDNFSDSIPILATLGISLAILVGCSVASSRAAENSRQLAIARLNEQMIAAANNPALVAQLSTLLARAQALAEGAFTPWSQKPLVKAVLLPIGSYAGTALLENSSLFGP